MDLSKLTEDKTQKSLIKASVWMIIVGDGLHNFLDGIAIGSSFKSDARFGFCTSMVCLLQEIPHELGDFAILRKNEFRIRMAVLVHFVSSVFSLFGLCIGMLMTIDEMLARYMALPFAGLFIYISIANIVNFLRVFFFHIYSL